MAAITNNNIARAIYETLKYKSEAERENLYPKVVLFLSKKRMLGNAGDILGRLDKIINTEEGKIEAKIYTARTLSDTTKKELREGISKKYGGKEVIIKEHLDEKILGGWRIEIGDEVIDTSLKNKIKKLQTHLIHSV